LTELIDVARASTKGSFFLFIGNTSSTIILALGSILIARLLGPENYGLYTVALITPSFLIALSDLGISPALTRFSARLRTQERHREAAGLIKAGILFKLLSSLLLALILLLTSDIIATSTLKRPEISLLIRLASLYLIGQSIYMTLNSTFIGLDKMEKSGLLMNIQAITKVVTSIPLVILGFATAGAILGAGLSFTLASGIGIGFILFRMNPEMSGGHGENVSFFGGLKTMVNYGMPLYISTLTLSLLTQYQSLILALFASNTEIGNYTTAMNFSVLITLISCPIATSLFPAFSKLSINEHRDSVEKMFKLSVKYTSLLIMPASFLIALLSQEAVYTLYGYEYWLAPGYLTLYALNFLCTGLGMFVLDSFFNGQGDTKATFKMSLAKLFPAALLAPILTLYYGVLGLIASILIPQFLSTTYGLYLTHKKYSISPDWKPLTRIGFASLASTLLVYITLNTAPINNYLYRLILGGTLYLTLFLAIAPIAGAVNKTDIQNLHESTKEIAIYPIIKTILKIETKILDVSAPSKV